MSMQDDDLVAGDDELVFAPPLPLPPYLLSPSGTRSWLLLLEMMFFWYDLSQLITPSITLALPVSAY